eukprot:377391-Rhodomonas_salina.1
MSCMACVVCVRCVCVACALRVRCVFCGAMARCAHAVSALCTKRCALPRPATAPSRVAAHHQPTRCSSCAVPSGVVFWT